MHYCHDGSIPHNNITVYQNVGNTVMKHKVSDFQPINFNTEKVIVLDKSGACFELLREKLSQTSFTPIPSWEGRPSSLPIICHSLKNDKPLGPTHQEWVLMVSYCVQVM